MESWNPLSGFGRNLSIRHRLKLNINEEKLVENKIIIKKKTVQQIIKIKRKRKKND